MSSKPKPSERTYNVKHTLAVIDQALCLAYSLEHYPDFKPESLQENQERIRDVLYFHGDMVINPEKADWDNRYFKDAAKRLGWKVDG